MGFDNPLGISDTAIKRHGKIRVTVPIGRTVTGWMPGLSGGTLAEHVLRDRLAQQIRGVTEASLGYGRADVLTATTVFEVEHHTKWRTAVRQALQYAAQTGCTPAVALFGDGMTTDQMLHLFLRLRDGKPPMQLWWYGPGYGDMALPMWHSIGSRVEASACRGRW
jgi:hypothetical protein